MPRYMLDTDTCSYIMKRSNLLALAFAVALSGLSIGSAHAAPVATPPCYRNSSATHDMAGRYSAAPYIAR